jgi:hypothetical protein
MRKGDTSVSHRPAVESVLSTRRGLSLDSPPPVCDDVPGMQGTHDPLSAYNPSSQGVHEMTLGVTSCLVTRAHPERGIKQDTVRDMYMYIKRERGTGEGCTSARAPQQLG